MWGLKGDLQGTAPSGPLLRTWFRAEDETSCPHRQDEPSLLQQVQLGNSGWIPCHFSFVVAFFYFCLENVAWLHTQRSSVSWLKMDVNVQRLRPLPTQALRLMFFSADRFTCCLFSSSLLLHAASSALTSPPPAVKSQRPPGRPCSFFPSGPTSTGKTPDFCQIPPWVLPPSVPLPEIPAHLLCMLLACACHVETRFLFNLLLFSKDETNSPSSNRVKPLGYLSNCYSILSLVIYKFIFQNPKLRWLFWEIWPVQHSIFISFRFLSLKM